MKGLASTGPGRRWHLIVALGAALPLAGCGGNVLDTLGLVPPTPNAFLVTTEPPLAIPPDLNALPPPKPGEARPQAVPARLRAEETLVPAIALSGTEGAMSPGQHALIAAAAPASPADAKAELARQPAPDTWQQGPLSWLLFWRSTPPPGVVIDPTKEARRLQTDAALGRPPTYGQTPILKREGQSIF